MHPTAAARHRSRSRERGCDPPQLLPTSAGAPHTTARSASVRAVTAAPSPRCARLAEFSAHDLRARLAEALSLYVAAMNYPEATAQQRAPMWTAHMLRPGWRCIGAVSDDDELVAIGYGYLGTPGQWWHEQVRRGLMHTGTSPERWIDDYFELTELHVRPDWQGSGLGEDVARRLLSPAPAAAVLLSTPEGPTRAWRLYRRMGFQDVLRQHQFAGDPRPFAVLGRSLPLEDAEQ